MLKSQNKNPKVLALAAPDVEGFSRVKKLLIFLKTSRYFVSVFPIETVKFVDQDIVRYVR